MADLQELMTKTRTCRRFFQDEPISAETLRLLINMARMAGSAQNLQPIKYMLVNDPAANTSIFPHLGWAGYLPDWPGPVDGERPAAYIICLLDTRISRKADCDLGIATQNILLAATAQGLGGCRIGSVSPALHKTLSIPEHLKILLALALGRPKEIVTLEDVSQDGNIRYWRDSQQVHHVPKRPLDELIIRNTV